MATLINRSRYTVKVPRRADLNRNYPHDQMDDAERYIAELRDQGHQPKLEQADDAWYVRIRQKGYADQCFDGGSYKAAEAAVKRIESEREHGLFIDYTTAHRVTLASLIERYVQEVCPDHKGCAVETSILESLLTDLGEDYAKRVLERKKARAEKRVEGTKKKARVLPPRHEPRDKDLIQWLVRPLAQVMPTDINQYIKDRVADLDPATVDREIDVLSQVLTWTVKTLRIHINTSPLVGVHRPRYFNERDRRLSPDEERRLFDAAREEDRLLAPELALDAFRPQVAAIPDVHESTRKRRLRELREQIASGAIAAPVIPYWETYIQFLLFTAARRSEAIALRWADVNYEAQSAFLPDTKNGRSRDLILRAPMIEALKRLPRSDVRVFPFTLNWVRERWNRIVERAGLKDFVMHDLRHVALTRICEEARAAGRPMTLPELATVSGHRDLRTLARYLNLCAGELARRIDEAHKIAAYESRAALTRKKSPLPSQALHKGRVRPRIRVSAADVAREAMRNAGQLPPDATPDEMRDCEPANTLPA